MKSKLFRKAVAGISALAMVATAAVVPIVSEAAESTTLYERGVTTQWSDSDLNDWKLTEDMAKPTINSSYGLYADNNMTGYVSKALTVSDGAVVTYDVDFYTNSSTGRTNNYAYIKFGSNVTVGYNSNYKLYYSTDGGTSYNTTELTGKVNGATTNIKAVINTSSNKLVSLNVGGKDVSEASNTDLSGASYDSISMGFVRAGSVSWTTQYALKDVSVTEVIDKTTYYTVKYNVDGKESSESVASGKTVETSSIPDTTKTGYIFKGWSKDGSSTLITTEQLESLSITADTTFTAVYEEDASYIEPIVSAVITGPDKMTMGSDPDTAEDNKYSVTLTGERGTVITSANANSAVSDFNIDWDIDGFATENDQPGQYCDSYGEFAEHGAAATDVTFKLRNVPMNFYGKMTADITYNGQKITASKYVAALGNTNSDVNYALPEAGYPSDFDEYPDSLIGYSVLKDTYAASTDTMVGGWVVAGSDDGGKAVITSENGNKFVRVTAGTVKKSHVLTNSISSPKTQMIFEQDVRFNSAGGVLTLTSGYPFWSNKNYTNPVTVKYNGSTITLNGTAITKNESEAAISSGVWYKIVLSVDKTTETCYVKVYDASGNLVGETENIGWSETSTPTYYSVGIANDSTGTIDFDNYSAYYPTVDESTYTLNTSADTLSIPNGDTADLTASLKTADGYDVTGLASWSIVEDDMKEGVIITPDENDSHKAKVTLSDTAESGEATVQVNIGGYIKTITLNITSSSESVKFTKSSSSVSIPLDSEPITAVYKAIVADGNGNDMGRDVTLALYDKTNTEAYTLPSGISFNESTGVLTVDSNASATAFTVRATGKNSDGESISKSIKVTVHGLSFDFGEDTDEAVAEGYTAVTKDTAYTETRGYGITGTATSGGTASTENASSDYLEGNIGFNAKVQSGKLYTVNVVYQGTLTTGYVSSDLSGYTLGTQTTLTEAEYTVPVVGDILDLKLTGTDAKLAALTITKKADKEASAKPSIYHIGDSTAANNGSWAYYIDHNRSLFPELNDIVTFCNSGAGGRNLCTYYTEGKLAEVLKNINPGDIVMFGNMGTNGMGSSFEDDVNYYLDAAEAMGARIIINSYTPHGANGSYTSVYNSSTNTFNGYRTDSYDVIVRRIASEREENDENYIGFVEIGKNADAAFNAYVADYEANGYASADAAAQAIIACFSDHNHYSNGSIARELMLNGYGNIEGIVPQLVKLLIPQVEVKEIGSSIDKNGIEAAAYLASWTPNGYAAKSLVWKINNSDNTKTHTETVELPDTIISGGVTVVSGLIIQTEDINTLGEVSASLSK